MSCVCTLSHGHMYFQQKTSVLHFGRALTQNSWICHIIFYGWLAWWCDFFPVGPTFEDHPHVFSQKRSSPLEFISDTCASASSSHLFWLVKLNICGCRLFQGQMYVQQKTSVLHFGRALTQNSWICPIMSYLWMVGLVMRLFSCWANLWRSSACIQPKKGPAPWNLFLTPAPLPLQVTLFGWWSWTYVVAAFC